MTIHLCRDFKTLPSASFPGTIMYALSAFMHSVLDFGTLAYTNFNLLSYKQSFGTAASINTGLGGEYEVLIPSASYVVTSSDVDRILALKSIAWSRHNSGLFRISSVDIGINALIIDYRSTEFPPAETGLTWAIFSSENEVSGTWSSGSKGGDGYASRYPASASRIILKSPETVSNWLVRLTLESLKDVQGAAQTGFSIAPGFNSDEWGDFPIGEEHLHGAMFYDSTSSLHAGLTIGPSQFNTSNIEWTKGVARFNIIGDDETGSTGIVIRGSSSIDSTWSAFGVPDDDDQFQKTRLFEKEQIKRLFVLGLARNLTGSSNLTWRFDYQDRAVLNGLAWGDTCSPVPCIASSYFPAANDTTSELNVELWHQSNAANNPWTNSTDLIDVELLVGSFDGFGDFSLGKVIELLPRRLGQLPFFKMGRANFGNWTLGLVGSQSSSWLHTSGGVYMNWGGPRPTDISFGSNVILLESAAASSSFGLLMSDPRDPGDDLTVITSPGPGHDIDSVRFRKTYSYFRQEPRLIGIEKKGSNTPPSHK